MVSPREQLLLEAGVFNQPDYQIFRRWHAERKAPLVIVLGSGMSVSAGLPNWEGLSDALDKACEGKVSSLNKIADDLYHLRSKLESARINKSYWVKFKLYKEILTEATFVSIVREALAPKSTAKIPDGYRRLLRLSPRGVVTVNLDPFAAQALTIARPSNIQTPIYGKDIARRWEIIQSADPFLVYLHGHIAESSSWVLDQDDLAMLQADQGHTAFLQYLFMNCQVLFFGISADDVALSAKLIEARTLGFKPQALFWLTDRTDSKLNAWANENWVRVINYRAKPSHSEVLDAFVDDCANYRPGDTVAPPVLPKHSFNSTSDLAPDQLAQLEPDEIRKYLSDKISTELDGIPHDEEYSVFSKLIKLFARAVHNSYFISEEEGETWFDLRLIQPSLGEGTFGQVYQAAGRDGDIVAVKIMREAIHQKTEMLGAFRRGVRSMRIISDANLPGMIRIKDAFELPPTIIMEFINGVSLEQAIKAKVAHPWAARMRMIKDVASIVRRAHLLPETVLHRDLKPSNIMLKDYDFSSAYEPEIVVLDFDMSWHKDSTEKDVLFEARDDFAYLAPEQVSPKHLGLSRSTLVDSYGLGMTAYYVFGGEHPQINAYLSPEWPIEVLRAVRKGYNGDWRSAPKRLARLIIDCTKSTQSERADFGQIIGELNDLESALIGIAGVKNGELVAEELIAQICGSDGYKWDSTSRSAHLHTKRGVELRSWSDDRRSRIDFSVSWINQGEVDRSKVAKYIEAAISKSFSGVNSSAWSSPKHEQGSGQLKISISIDLASCRQNWQKAISTAAQIYRNFDFA